MTRAEGSGSVRKGLLPKIREPTSDDVYQGHPGAPSVQDSRDYTRVEGARTFEKPHVMVLVRSRLTVANTTTKTGFIQLQCE